MMLQNSTNTVLGLVGNAAVGKDSIAKIFQSRGFTHYSASDVVREEVVRRGLGISRENQTVVANEVRTIQGGDYFIMTALKRAQAQKPDAPVLLSGIYAPSEGVYINSVLNGALVEIVTNDEDPNDLRARYSRLVMRADGTRDVMDFEDFCEAHLRENSGLEPDATNVLALSSMSKYRIVNHDGIQPDILGRQVDEILTDIGGF